MSRKPYMKYVLNDDEYNTLNKIARKLGVDCWFSLIDETNDNGITIATKVYDLERKHKVSLQYGIRLLNDAFEADKTLNSSMMTNDELNIYDGILKNLKI